MRYFFLTYALIALLVVGIFGLRGQKFSKPPVRIFPDMDEQDKLKPQKPEYEFGGQSGYYYTGHIGDYFGTGMPEELELTEESAAALLRRGQERYGIYCAICHGDSGDGQGITGQYGVPGIANFHLDNFKSATYPDGRMYDVITNGKGMMGAYGYNIPVKDRWAIIAYVRALQVAKDAQTKAQ
jgi:mono/diheme cytochrome c family protein